MNINGADTTKYLIDIEFGSYSCGLLFNGKGDSTHDS